MSYLLPFFYLVYFAVSSHLNLGSGKIIKIMESFAVWEKLLPCICDKLRTACSAPGDMHVGRRCT